MAHDKRAQRMQRVPGLRTLVLFDLLIQPRQHLAVMHQKRFGRGILVAQLEQSRSQNFFVRQCTLEYALAESLLLDLGDAAIFRITFSMRIRKSAQQLTQFDHTVESIQRAAAHHFLQGMARYSNQPGDTRKWEKVTHGRILDALNFSAQASSCKKSFDTSAKVCP